MAVLETTAGEAWAVRGQPPGDLHGLVASLADHVAELVTVFDSTGVLLWANRSMTRILGLDPGDWIGRHAVELAHPDDIPLGMELLVSAQATGEGVKEPVVYRLRTADDGWRDLECICANVRLASGAMALVVTGRPAGEARPPTAIFDEASHRVSWMFEQSLIAMAQVSLAGDVLRANPRFAQLVGAARPDALPGRSLRTAFDGSERARVELLLTGAGGERRPLRVATGPGAPAVWAHVSSSLVRDHRGEPLYYAVQAIDISDLIHVQEELRAVEAELRHRSSHDALTGLANRTQLDAWAPRVAGPDGAAIFLDLDGFKDVNDANGHATGDALLAVVAGRLRSHIRRGDVLVRFGGDEFVVVCAGLDEGAAEALAHRLAACVREPIVLDGTALHVGASVGVALGDGRTTYESLLARADAALYEAKAGAQDVVVVKGRRGPQR